MWGELFGSIFSWLGGESIAASLTRVAIGVGLMRYLNKSNQNAQPTNSTQTPQGIRQQISPATDNKIPVVYGDAYLGGTIVDVQLVNGNKELYAVLALCEKTGDLFSSGAQSDITIDDVYFNNHKIKFKADGTTLDYVTDDTGVQDTNGSGLLSICLYKGNSNSPMLPCQSGTTTPIAGTVPPVAYQVMPGWGSSHTMENIVFAVIKMNYDPSKGLRSIPNLKFHVRNTLNKPGDVLHDYMTNALYGGNVDAATIDSAGITALNSYSDQSVTYPGHAAQKRYVINGVIRTTETVMSNMQRIAGSAGSNVTYDIASGKWSVVINKAGTKSLDFNDSNIIGQVAVTGTALDGYYNSVEVQFPYAYLRDQMNFVRIDLPESLRNANEPDNQLQITHELVNNVVQANILGNMDLRQSREDLAITFDTDYSKFNVQVGDVIGVTNAVYGWTSKLFRVIRVKKNESDGGRLTLQITAQSYNADVYTVESINDFTPLIGAGHSIPNLGAIQKPGKPTVDTGSTISSQPSITITATVPTGVVTEMEFWYTPDDTEPNDNLRRYYLLGTTRSENSGPFSTGAITSFKTVLLQTDNYYFKVRAANQYGTSSFSDPSDMVNYTYVQAPDVLPYSRPVVDEDGNTLDDNGNALNMGMLAMYLATKLNWGGLLDDITSGNISWGTLGNLFGIGSNAASKIGTSAASTANLGIFKTVDANGTNIVAVGTNDTLHFRAGEGIYITGNAGKKEVTISTSPPVEQTFELIASANAVSEGTSVIFTLNTSGIEEGTNVAYNITGISSDDIDGADLSGNFTIYANTDTKVYTVTSDNVTEGETMTMTLVDYPNKTASVQIIDGAPESDYTLTRSHSSITEGGTFAVTLDTVNVADGTAVPYVITGVDSDDISGAALSGTFIVSNNHSVIYFTTTIDNVLEGVETFTLTLTGISPTKSVSVNILDPQQTTGTLLIGTLYPPNRTTYYDPITGLSSDKAPVSGSYFIKYASRNGSTLYGPLMNGTGQIKLYKSNGTLVETLLANQLIINFNLVEFPFTKRELGTDYYILMDAGVVTYCGFAINAAIIDPLTWNFNTPLYETTPYAPTADAVPTYTANLVATSSEPVGNACPQAYLTLNFNRNVLRGNGTAYIKKMSDNSTVVTLAPGQGTSSGSSIVFDTLENLGLQDGVEYYVTGDTNVAKTLPFDCYALSQPSNVIVKTDNFKFTPTWIRLVDFYVKSDPWTGTNIYNSDFQRANRQTNIWLIFNRPVRFGPSGAVKIYRGDGVLHQQINVNTSFNTEKTSELIWVADLTDPLPQHNIDNNTVIINPTKDMESGYEYYVQVDPGAIWDDLCEMPWQGVQDTSTIRFKIDEPKVSTTTPPSLSSSYATIIYDRGVMPSTGSINIYDSQNNLVKTINSDDPSVTFF